MNSCNGRNMIKGTCYICGTKKSVSLSSTAFAAPHASTTTAAKHQGEGFDLNNLINNLPIEFHQYAEKGEYISGGLFSGSTEIFLFWSRYPIRAENEGGMQGYQRVG